MQYTNSRCFRSAVNHQLGFGIVVFDLDNLENVILWCGSVMKNPLKGWEKPTLFSVCTTTGIFPSAAFPYKVSLPLLSLRILRSVATDLDIVGV